MLYSLALVLLCGSFMRSAHAADPAPLADAQSLDEADKRYVRGITISTHGGGRDWGTDVIVPTMEEIRDLGANWVSIHPYARIREDGTVRFRPFDPADPPAYLARPIAEAHRLGLSICIKPHLAYWGSPFSWRGDITFSEEEEWKRFWEGYSNWILALAEACRQADGFIVGTELDRTLSHEPQWRDLIARVRALTDAPLTYAANWTDYQQVPFWDALDVIGIQAYFPLTGKTEPSAADLREGWERRLVELRAFADRQNRDILFTELGYNQSYLAAVEPWNYRVDDEGARRLQELCWQVALEVIASEPRLVGALLWKWFPYPNPVGRNFQLASPHIRRIISSAWRPTEQPALLR